MKDKKILFLKTGGHPVHLDFAKAINADIKEMSWRIPKNYDVYISEASYIQPAILKRFGFFKKNAKLINLFADPRLYYLDKNYFFDKKSKKIKKYPLFKRRIYLNLLKEIDGGICVGKMVSELFQKYLKRKPFLITPVVISEKREEILKKVNPSLDKKNIIFIGSGPDSNYKGLDILLESFRTIKKNIPDCKLRIIGKWDDSYDKLEDGIFFEGIRENIEDYLKDSCLMLHLGRGDTFPTTTIEAMMAGVITLVSNETGTKEIVYNVDKKNVLELNAKKISKRVIDILKLSKKNKINLSKTYKKEAKKLNRKSILNNFKLNFKELLKKIEYTN